MKLRLRIILSAVVVLVAALWLRGCVSTDQPIPKQEFSRKPLASKDTFRVTSEPHQIIVDTHKGTVSKYVPEEGEAEVTVTDEGQISVTVKNKGLTHQLGIGALMADKPRLGFDYEFAYWNRFGYHLGLGVNNAPVVVGFAAVSYQLDQLHLKNTSLYVGYTTTKDIAVGLRVSF